jgi:hypothetical protein
VQAQVCQACKTVTLQHQNTGATCGPGISNTRRNHPSYCASPACRAHLVVGTLAHWHRHWFRLRLFRLLLSALHSARCGRHRQELEQEGCGQERDEGSRRQTVQSQRGADRARSGAQQSHASAVCKHGGWRRRQTMMVFRKCSTKRGMAVATQQRQCRRLLAVPALVTSCAPTPPQLGGTIGGGVVCRVPPSPTKPAHRLPPAQRIRARGPGRRRRFAPDVQPCPGPATPPTRQRDSRTTQR